MFTITKDIQHEWKQVTVPEVGRTYQYCPVLRQHDSPIRAE